MQMKLAMIKLLPMMSINVSGTTFSLKVKSFMFHAYHENSKNVNGFLFWRALEELDSLLLHASRNQPGASVKSMKSNIGIAVNALNRYVYLLLLFLSMDFTDYAIYVTPFVPKWMSTKKKAHGFKYV